MQVEAEGRARRAFLQAREDLVEHQLPDHLLAELAIGDLGQELGLVGGHKQPPNDVLVAHLVGPQLDLPKEAFRERGGYLGRERTRPDTAIGAILGFAQGVPIEILASASNGLLEAR